MGNFTHIKITAKGHKDLKYLASSNNKTQIAYASRAFIYLKKTGLNIFDDDDAIMDIPAKLTKMNNTFISFLKKRETDFFVPMNDALHQQINILQQVMFALETFDIVSFTQQKKDEFNNPQKPLLKAPKISQINELEEPLQDPENVAENKEDLTLENEVEKKPDINDIEQENELLKMKVESIELKSNGYKKELEYFLKNIVPGSALSSTKYVFKGNQNDLKRVKALIQ